MTRNIFTFLGTFVAGALLALVVRSATFEPHAEHAASASNGGDYAPMVTNPLAPTPGTDVPETASSTSNPAAADPHAAHRASASTAVSDKPVNTICAICGMEVDPNLPTAQYQGQTIGFGCKMCPPKFKADPDRWGPFYLRNEVAKK
jgi:hypothetical protein